MRKQALGFCFFLCHPVCFMHLLLKLLASSPAIGLPLSHSSALWCRIKVSRLWCRVPFYSTKHPHAARRLPIRLTSHLTAWNIAVTWAESNTWFAWGVDSHVVSRHHLVLVQVWTIRGCCRSLNVLWCISEADGNPTKLYKLCRWSG